MIDYGYLKEKNVLNAFSLKAFYEFYNSSLTNNSSRIVDRGISNHIRGSNSARFIRNYIGPHKKRFIRKVKRLEIASRILEEL